MGTSGATWYPRVAFVVVDAADRHYGFGAATGSVPDTSGPGRPGCAGVRGGRLVAATVIVATAAATVTCCRSPPHCASLVASEGDPWIVLTAPDQRLCDGVPSATSNGRFPRKSALRGLPSAGRREHETEDKTLGANVVHQLGVLVESIIRHRASPLIHHPPHDPEQSNPPRRFRLRAHAASRPP